MPKTAKAGVPLLEHSPSHLLHQALQFALDVYAAEGGEGAPTQRQFAVLAAVEFLPAPTQTDLVRATGIDRSTLADMVARMTAKGWLARERSNLDGRANLVRLTDEGRAALEAAQPRAEAADARILHALGSGKRDPFVSALRALGRANARALLGGTAEPDGGEDAKARDGKAKRDGKKKDKKRKKDKPAPDAAAPSA